jgi:hypothetical protein
VPILIIDKSKYACIFAGERKKLLSMKKILILLLPAILFMASCSNPAGKLKGEWKVTDVKTEFGKTKLPPELVAHIVAEQKKISFRILNDSVMVLLLDNNTHEAKWRMDKDHNISYWFTTQPGVVNKLGRWDGTKITSDSKTPLGDLIVTYEKK